jgi:hypothetical protein
MIPQPVQTMRGPKDGTGDGVGPLVDVQQR